MLKDRLGSKAETRSSHAFGIGIGGFPKKMLEEPFDAFTFSTGRSVGLSARQIRDGAQGTDRMGSIMKPNPPHSGVSRRALLSTLTVLPAAAGRLFRSLRQAQAESTRVIPHSAA